MRSLFLTTLILVIASPLTFLGISYADEFGDQMEALKREVILKLKENGSEYVNFEFYLEPAVPGVRTRNLNALRQLRDVLNSNQNLINFRFYNRIIFSRDCETQLKLLEGVIQLCPGGVSTAEEWGRHLTQDNEEELRENLTPGLGNWTEFVFAARQRVCKKKPLRQSFDPLLNLPNLPPEVLSQSNPEEGSSSEVVPGLKDFLINTQRSWSPDLRIESRNSFNDARASGDPRYLDRKILTVSKNGKVLFIVSFDRYCHFEFAETRTYDEKGNPSGLVRVDNNGRIAPFEDGLNPVRLPSNEIVGPCQVDTGTAPLELELESSTTTNPSKLAIIDVGFDINHPALAHLIDRYGWDGICTQGLDTVYGDNIPSYTFDRLGLLPKDHGTKVAGVACRGVEEMQILPISIGRTAQDFNVDMAIDMARLLGYRTVNLSIGTNLSPEKFASLRRSIERNPDMLFVAAAGNEEGNFDDGFRAWPPSWGLDNVVVVAAFNRNSGDLWEHSNYGAGTVHIAADGVDEPVPQYFGNSPQDTTASGTSIAAPQVSRVAARIFATNPTLSVAEAREIIFQSATRMENLTGTVFGGRYLNEEAALQLASEWMSWSQILKAVGNDFSNPERNLAVRDFVDGNRDVRSEENPNDVSDNVIVIPRGNTLRTLH
ncbi:S8 family serine peptidase [Bdellovibrionota bacterium]